jgi:ornithine cyclodeaminase/alanine dehydrogenase-like protein (mu-crystallin family)
VEARVEVRVIARDEVRRLLPMGRCIDLMADALASLAAGEADNPLRSVMRLPRHSAALGMMPAALGSPAAIGLKVISVFPGNRGSGYESHQGFVLLFEAEHGAPVALVDAGEITAIRTAAVSGVATRLLAQDEADDLAILGSGTQARTHLEAMLLVRPGVRRVRAWSPNTERLESFAIQATQRHGLRVEATASARDAVGDASIVCTVTASPTPILEGEWLSAGAHVNAVGASQPNARELDVEAVRRSRLFVDRRESALHECGDLLAAMEAGALDEGHIVAELGEILAGVAVGRRDAAEITLFESLGLAVEDLAAAREVWRLATEQDVGTLVRLQ